MEIVAKASEFEEIRFQSGEKTILNEINKDSRLKFKQKGKIKDLWQKIFCVMNAVLADIPLSEFKIGHLMIQESQWILTQASRIVRCIDLPKI